MKLNKVRTSITLSPDLLQTARLLVGRNKQHKNRSEFIEMALRSYIALILRRERDKKDLEILNREAEKLNEEALDVLSYQEVP